MERRLGIRLYGAFQAFSGDGTQLSLGAKHQAILALLATAPDGTRTRSFLEAHLWSLVPPEQAKASLRTALSTLRRSLGADAAQLLSANRERVTLNPDAFELIGTNADGPFMEGFDLPGADAFEDWLRTMRSELPQVSAHPGAAVGVAGDARRLSIEELLPSIAILPMLNRADPSSSNPLGSILAEEISRQLSRSHGFSVTSYLTTRQFHPLTTSADEVVRTCGVQYLLTGTVSVSGQDFRLVADYQDARGQRLLWSREFHGTLTELIAGDLGTLGDLTTQIGRTTIGEALRLARSTPLSQLENHSLIMAGISLLQEARIDQFARAREIFELLTKREPRHPLTLTWLGFWHVMNVQKGLSQNRIHDTQVADELADRALDLDPAFSLAQTLKGMVASHLLGRFDLAASAYNLAISDNPNEALALLLKGAMRAFQNEAPEAVKLTEAARRLSPLDPQAYYFDALAATAHLAAGNYDRAIALADQSLVANDAYPSTLRTKAIALELAGRGGEARQVVKGIMALSPEFRVSRYRAEHPAAGYRVGQEWARALKAAGVPD